MTRQKKVLVEALGLFSLFFFLSLFHFIWQRVSQLTVLLHALIEGKECVHDASQTYSADFHALWHWGCHSTVSDYVTGFAHSVLIMIILVVSNGKVQPRAMLSQHPYATLMVHKSKKQELRLFCRLLPAV